MMDIVERLREEASWEDGAGVQQDFYHAEILNEAATLIESQAAEIARLREALEWYAKSEIYEPHPHGPAFERRDLSYRARAALKEPT